MRVLVTGGAGFIGSHLCEALLARGDTVICIDNFATGTRENISSYLMNARFTFIEHDMRHPLPDIAQCDLVFHLASIASPWKYLTQRYATLQTNVLGMYHALEWCRHTHAGLVFASTSEVYGDPHVHPQDESYWGNVNPIGPRACYDEGKRIGETYATVYQHEFNLSVGIARIFNTYGPRMTKDDGRPIINFSIQALSQKPITVHSDGSQTRSFCYVDDLVRGLLLLAEKGMNQGPINLGNPDERSIISVAEFIKQELRADVPLSFQDALTDDPKRRLPAIEKAQRLLGWTPRVSFEEGVRATIPWIRQTFFP